MYCTLQACTWIYIYIYTYTCVCLTKHTCACRYQNNGYGTKALNALLRHLSTSLANVSAARESPDSIPISSIAHSYFQSPFTSALAYTLPDKKDSAGLHQLIDRATTTNHGSGTDKLEKNGSPIEIDGQGGLPLSMRMCEKDNTSADARKTMGAHQRVGGADTLCVFVAADIAAVSFFRKHGFAEMEHHQSAKTKQYTHTRTHAYTYARGDGGGLRSNMSVEGDDDDDDEDPIVATIAPINLNYLGYASNSESVGGNGGSSADMDTNDCDANRDPSHKSSHQSIAQINDQSHSSAQQSQPSLQQVDIKTVFPAILPVSQRRTLELTLGHLHRYDDAVPMYMLMHID